MLIEHEFCVTGIRIERIRSALSQAKCQEVKVGFSSFFTLEFPRPTFTGNAKPKAGDQNLRPELRLESKLAAKVIVHLDKQEEGKAGLAKMLGHKTVYGNCISRSSVYWSFS